MRCTALHNSVRNLLLRKKKLSIFRQDNQNNFHSRPWKELFYPGSIPENKVMAKCISNINPIINSLISFFLATKIFFYYKWKIKLPNALSTNYCINVYMCHCCLRNTFYTSIFFLFNTFWSCFNQTWDIWWYYYGC